jgi:hypothetical protein
MLCDEEKHEGNLVALPAERTEEFLELLAAGLSSEEKAH